MATTIKAQDATTTGGPVDRVATLINSLPDDLDHAGEAVGNAMRSVSTSVSGAQDGSLLAGASLAAGVAIGLLLGGGPRLLAAAAVASSLSLGVTLMQRRAMPGRAGA
jgi:hypothetical protein